jgi:hypothetical protein
VQPVGEVEAGEQGVALRRDGARFPLVDGQLDARSGREGQDRVECGQRHIAGRRDQKAMGPAGTQTCGGTHREAARTVGQ